MNFSEEKTGLVKNNLGLVHACANKFRGRGVEYEDLFQSGCVGLIKAAEGFDSSLGYKFSTYAVPAVLGEIRRIFRDGGAVKIGRSAKEKSRQLINIRNELSDKLLREPTVSEIAEKAQLDIFTVSELLSASLPVISLTSSDGEADFDVPVPPADEALTEKIDLKRAISKLDETEKSLVELRFFKNLTQSAAAEKLGMTQVQVSRKEKALLLKLRKLMEE